MVRSKTALPLGGMILGVHMLNAFGHATVAIIQFLEGAGPGVRYSWEPLDTPHPDFHMPADADAADDADDKMTEAYVPPEGVRPAQPPPPPASNWEAITQLVRILGAMG